MKTAAGTAEMRTTAIAPRALVTIALATIDTALFVACHLVAYTIAHVVAIAIAFVGGQ